jgi:hypothetical protein
MGNPNVFLFCPEDGSSTFSETLVVSRFKKRALFRHFAVSTVGSLSLMFIAVFTVARHWHTQTHTVNADWECFYS